MKFRFGSIEKYDDEIRKCERLLDMVRSRMADTESYRADLIRERDAMKKNDMRSSDVLSRLSDMTFGCRSQEDEEALLVAQRIVARHRDEV